MQAVELRREESRGRLQDLVGPPQLGDLLLHSGISAISSLVLPGRAPRRSRPDGPIYAESRATRSPTARRSTGSPRTHWGVVLGLHHQRDRALSQLPRVLRGTCHDFILRLMKSPDIPGRFTAWPWQSAWSDLFNHADGPPPAPTTPDTSTTPPETTWHRGQTDDDGPKPQDPSSATVAARPQLVGGSKLMTSGEAGFPMRRTNRRKLDFRVPGPLAPSAKVGRARAIPATIITSR